MSVSRRYTIEIGSDDIPSFDRPPHKSRAAIWKLLRETERLTRTPRNYTTVEPNEMYETFEQSKYFHLDYLCVYTKNTKRCIYVLPKETVSHSTMATYLLSNRELGPKDYWKSRQFERGEIIFEKGERPIAPAKRRRLLPRKILLSLPRKYYHHKSPMPSAKTYPIRTTFQIAPASHVLPHDTGKDKMTGPDGEAEQMEAPDPWSRSPVALSPLPRLLLSSWSPPLSSSARNRAGHSSWRRLLVLVSKFFLRPQGRQESPEPIRQ
ncbi:unnamed protein product [Scytosiphon promiscuus]